MAFTSCVDTVILPDDMILDEDYWQKKSDVESVVATAYSQLRDATFQRNMIIWADFRSDELVKASNFTTRNNVTDALDEVSSMLIMPNNMFTTWYPLYSCINYCNLVLEKGEQVMSYDPDYTQGDWLVNKAQIKGLRALCYFYLVRVFRDVPVTPHAYLNSSEDLTIEQQAPATVLQMCIDDLNEAVEYAPQNDAFYDPNATIDARNQCYMNRDAINALLADIYLWRASVNHDMADYQKAIEHCDKVLAAKRASHKFSPLDKDQTPKDYYLENYDDMYRKIFVTQNSEEIIFQIHYNNNLNNSALSQYYYGYKDQNSGWGYLKATRNYSTVSGSTKGAVIYKQTEDVRIWENVYEANSGIEQNDIRKFVALNSINGIGKNEKRASGRANFQQNWIVYRITDIMLMKAEALLQLGENDETMKQEAFKLIATVNDRSINSDDATKKLDGKYSAYKNNLENLLLLERARELCFEGKRWFDLMRLNYRNMTGVDYTKKLTELNGDFAENSDVFFDIALNKYSGQAAMKAKMPSEPYLYMPLNEDELKSNPKLIQNPVYKSTTK